MSSGLHIKKSIISACIAVFFLQGMHVFAVQNIAHDPADPSADVTPAPQLPAIILTADAADKLAQGQITQTNQAGMLGEKDTLDIPFSVTGYSAAYIENQQATSVAAALKSEPSVRTLFSANGLGEYFNIRGFYTQSHELAWNGLFGLVPHNRMPTEFLERVEVFRGSSALLNGMSLGGAVGGVINVVPKRATREDMTRLTTSYASDRHIGLHVDIGRRFGEQQQFGIRVNALKSQGDLIIDGQDQDRRLGAIALDYKGDRLNASLDIYDIHEKVDGGLPLMLSFASSNLPKAPDSSINTQPGNYAHTETQGIIANVQYEFLPAWTAYFTAGSKRQKGYGAIANNSLGMNAQPNGDYKAMSRMTANDTNVLAAETGIRGKFKYGAVQHQWVFSGNMIEQESYSAMNASAPWDSNIYRPVAGQIAARPSSVPKSSETTLSSLALADTLSLREDQYQLILGLRYQRVQSDNFAANRNRYDETAVTPALGIVMKPWGEQLSFYVNYIEGLSEGARVSDTTASNYNEVFAPYKSKQYEIGSKWDIGTFRNTLSFYQIIRPSLIKDLSSNRYRDDGKQRNRGVEWTTAGEVLEHVRLLGGVAYLDAVQRKTAAGAYDGNDAMGIPHWQSNLGLEWDVPYLNGLTLGANTVYTGTMYADDANQQKIPSWSEVDMSARYTTMIAKHAVTLRGGVDNLFDKKHWAGVWNGFSSVSGTPRSYKLAVQIDF
ncbi:TonB-dependent receptor [Acinetobacter larvae]|uniref:Ligand-gated channel protein n=1 Tax=Acinetobacter larvae TaxID=1789224 RepID=A0A1B2LWI9_9GAMM|nr:TonB-dependent receptor [Acinetobacter larvae]AOA57307.1 ligand-gated channel protein [Acinetobacter larvae]